ARGEGPQRLAIFAFQAVQLFVPPAKHDAVRGERGRREVREVSIAVGPQISALFDVNAKEGIFIMAEIGAVAVESRRAGNVSAGFNFFDLLAVRQRDDMEQGIASPEDSLAFGN